MFEPILTPETANIVAGAEEAIAALTTDDHQLRYYAAWWLGKHQVQSACGVLCAALADGYRLEQGGYPVRRQAARALGQLKNPDAVPVLIHALDCTEDIRLRAAAIQALAAIGDRRAISALLNLFNASPAPPLEVLIEALATFQVWSARPQIEPLLTHASERVQCAAAQYLYLLTHEAQYLERIVQKLNHENMYIRWAAIFDLGAINQSSEVVQAIIAAKVPNSLKLLNLKRILASVLDSADKSGSPMLLFNAIDDLLIQL